jgi:cytochrome o ubiquinol oxidase subunit II
VKKIGKKQIRIYIGIVIVWLVGLVVWYLRDKNFAVLNPAGEIAAQERDLLLLTVVLGLLVIIPVYIMLFTFAWRFRESNKKAKYSPDVTGNRWLETIWWGIPGIIILTLSVITWNTSHSLDPHKSIEHSKAPLNIQVIALDWKWLFIYPQQKVASVNWVQLPVDTPVTFYITADAPMNSFWIPQLAGQIYAMPGMSTQLHLIADKTGSFEGSSANLSGKGFAGMRFTAKAGDDKEFANWLLTARHSPRTLDYAAYTTLAKPSQNDSVNLYSSVEPDLYDKVVLKYMGPKQ